ncbi:regulator of nonsense transcripts 3A [Bombina bombina]|uniref:regulator of nonsense transcripts 3A n=1 Tax=Bombina bombina TaxID=8345 RepID=UPI00235ADCC8|nr:regulator of nonsense transcripts 3A [Bombina bombina]
MKSERESQPSVLRGNRESRSSESQCREGDLGGPVTNSSIKPRDERKAALSKVVIRRLPPGISKEQLEEQLHPLPAHDYFEFRTADPSLYPHLFSRAYINFRNPEDILLFRDRFDGFIFIDNKDLEYKKFLENYCAEEEKICANPETLLGEIEAKTKELIARRTTPLLEFIKNRKLEKQRIREEKREERRRRELEKKRIREEEKRKRREEERRKRKEADKQKKIIEKEIRIKLLKKPEKGDEAVSEKCEKIEETEAEEAKWEKSPVSANIKVRPFESFVKELKEKMQNDSDKEQRDDRRIRAKDQDKQRYRMEDGRKQRSHYEYEKFTRRNEDDQKWGKAYSQDRVKKGNHNSSFAADAVDKLGKEDKGDGIASKKDRLRNKDRPAMQLYQPGTRSRTTTEPTNKGAEEHFHTQYDNMARRSSEKTEAAE